MSLHSDLAFRYLQCILLIFPTYVYVGEIKVIGYGFHLHLLVYPFIYWFNTKITALVESTFWNPAELFIFISFHNHFKLFCQCVLLKTRISYRNGWDTEALIFENLKPVEVFSCNIDGFMATYI